MRLTAAISCLNGFLLKGLTLVFVRAALCLTIAAVLGVCSDEKANAQIAIKRPLIFVPGIFGSKLCRDGDDKQLVWGSVLALRSFPQLKLHTDGRTSDGRIESCGIIDEFVYFGPLGQDIYGQFLDALERGGYKRDKTLFVFSYDWRLSNFDNAERLKLEIEKYAASAGIGPDGQFDVIGHSMGGLLATILVNTGHPRIARLITVSTPYKGSVKLLSSLEDGWGWVQRRLVSMNQVRGTVLSFPSIYELLPTYRNCCALGTGVPGIPLDLSKADDFRRIGWFRDVPSDDLERRLESARRLHAILEGQPRIPGARMYGIQQETPEQLYLSGDADANPDRLIRKTVSSWLGDGTVMDYSAMFENDLGRLPGGVSHERMMSDGKIIKQVLNALDDRHPPDTISGTVLATCATSGGPRLDIDGATLKGTERIFVPDQDISITLSVRSSARMRDPAVLQTTGVEGRLVTSVGSSEIKFESVGTPQFDKENTRDGPVDFYTARFVANFRAPARAGDAAVEMRCGPGQDNPIAVWDFKVAP